MHICIFGVSVPVGGCFWVLGDYCSYHSSGVVLLVGGYYYQYQDYGAFDLLGCCAASCAVANIGSHILLRLTNKIRLLRLHLKRFSTGTDSAQPLLKIFRYGTA